MCVKQSILSWKVVLTCFLFRLPLSGNFFSIQQFPERVPPCFHRNGAGHTPSSPRLPSPLSLAGLRPFCVPALASSVIRELAILLWSRGHTCGRRPSCSVDGACVTALRVAAGCSLLSRLASVWRAGFFPVCTAPVPTPPHRPAPGGLHTPAAHLAPVLGGAKRQPGLGMASAKVLAPAGEKIFLGEVTELRATALRAGVQPGRWGEPARQAPGLERLNGSLSGADSVGSPSSFWTSVCRQASSLRN